MRFAQIRQHVKQQVYLGGQNTGGKKKHTSEGISLKGPKTRWRRTPEGFRGMQSKADDTEVTVSDKQPQEFKRLPHKRN